MNQTENIQALEQKLKSHLQPLFDKHFTLETWASIWAQENLAVSGEPLADLLEQLPVVYEIDGSINSRSGESRWDPACELCIGIQLKDYELPFKIMVNRGKIEELYINSDEFPVESLEMDLASEFEKKLTWLALNE